MKQPVYLLVGVPGVGKTYVTDRVGEGFEVVPHDSFIEEGKDDHNDRYVKGILKALETAKKPLIAEAPFSVSSIKDPLEAAGARVVPVILYEDRHTLAERYRNDPKRKGTEIPKGHLSRMETFRRRQGEYNAFMGNSAEVLAYLKDQAGGKRAPYVDVP